MSQRSVIWVRRALLKSSRKFTSVVILSCSHDASAQRPILFIAGPGGKSFDQNYIEAMTKALDRSRKLISVGEGVNAIHPKKVKEAILQTQGFKPLIIIHAHGGMSNGRFMLDLGLKQSVAIQDLFRDNTSPANIFLMACHSGGALVPGVFPKNSRVVAVCESTEFFWPRSHGEPFIAALANLPAERLEADSLALLPLYLVKGLQGLDLMSSYLAIKGNAGEVPPDGVIMNKVPPEFMVNDVKYNTDQILARRMGKHFSAKELGQAWGQLENIMSAKEIHRIALKIGSLQSVWGISGPEYGPAIAITLAAAESLADLPSCNQQWEKRRKRRLKQMQVLTGPQLFSMRHSTDQGQQGTP